MAKDKKLPYMQFYPADFDAEPTLKLCSWEAGFLWVKLLGLMHHSPERGFLLQENGLPYGEADLVKVIAGATPQRITDCMNELEFNGVFSRDRRKLIYCRKMVKGEKRAKNLKGEKTNKKDKSKINPTYSEDNPDLTLPATNGSTKEISGSDDRSLVIPETRDQRPDNKLSKEDNLFDNEKPKKQSVSCRLEKHMAKAYPDHPSDLPTDWGHDAIRIAKDYRPGTNLDLKKLILFQWDNFYDYWTSRNANAAKADWLKTWRNWWRREFEKYAEKEERDVRFQERYPAK